MTRYSRIERAAGGDPDNMSGPFFNAKNHYRLFVMMMFSDRP